MPGTRVKYNGKDCEVIAVLGVNQIRIRRGIGSGSPPRTVHPDALS